MIGRCHRCRAYWDTEGQFEVHMIGCCLATVGHHVRGYMGIGNEWSLYVDDRWIVRRGSISSSDIYKLFYQNKVVAETQSLRELIRCTLLWIPIEEQESGLFIFNKPKSIP